MRPRGDCPRHDCQKSATDVKSGRSRGDCAAPSNESLPQTSVKSKIPTEIGCRLGEVAHMSMDVAPESVYVSACQAQKDETVSFVRFPVLNVNELSLTDVGR
jgi:hypothetical protein